MPLTDSGYYIIARYYGPTSRLNGNTAKDIVYGGTPVRPEYSCGFWEIVMMESLNDCNLGNLAQFG